MIVLWGNHRVFHWKTLVRIADVLVENQIIQVDMSILCDQNERRIFKSVSIIEKSQSDVCLICLEPIFKNISFVHILNSLPICSNCIKKFHTLHLHEIWNEVPLTILYAYDEFFKSLLFQYKGLYDYALKDVFFALYKPQLQKKYRNHIYVIAPSNKKIIK